MSDWPHAPPHRLGATGSYFVTASTYKKRHHFNTKERLDVLQRGLLKLNIENNWQLEAWAIFSNHYHFIARPIDQPDATTLKPMISKLHEKTAKWINKRDEQLGRKVWHNFRDTHLSFENSYYARLKYVHHNAARHGMALRAEDYPWCSAGWFKRTAEASFVKTIESFKIDQVNVPDDFDPKMPEA
ncbi:transposase [Haloferula sp.]|uniref:transposase n=1 Tax=Haloferula sp. TaxID=2497595 RepID=UPI0032A0B0D0